MTHSMIMQRGKFRQYKKVLNDDKARLVSFRQNTQVLKIYLRQKNSRNQRTSTAKHTSSAGCLVMAFRLSVLNCVTAVDGDDDTSWRLVGGGLPRNKIRYG